jgi:AcrR family transcriptional regulator
LEGGGRVPMRPSRQSAANSREQIIAAAAQVFSERGFDDASTHAIADAAGVKEPLLFYHFKSKADLYIAAVQDQFRGEDEGATKTLPSFVAASADR